MPPPISKTRVRPHLVYYGNADAPVEIEVHGDLQCPFSKRGWGNVVKLAERYKPEQLRIVFQPFILFTHQWAWIASRAATVVAQLKPDSYFNFVELMFERQEQFHHAAGRDKTPTSMEELFASWAKETCGIEKEKFLETYESDDNYLWTKESHRAGILKGVWSTPTFAINGIEADKLGSSSSPDEWAALLDPMLDVDTSGGAAGAGSGTA